MFWWIISKLRELKKPYSNVELFDFGCEYAQEYIEVCKCGKKHKLSTQYEEPSSCYTAIYIKCRCGRSVRFDLPVG